MASKGSQEKYMPQEYIHYRGDKIVLIRQDPYGFGPGAIVCIDADGDGAFEHRVKTDADGIYTISFNAPQESLTEQPFFPNHKPCEPAIGDRLPVGVFSMFIRSADGTRESGVISVGTIQDATENLADAVPLNLVTTGFMTGEFPSDALPEKSEQIETGICTCTTCSLNDALVCSSLDGYAQSYTPTEQEVELATGKIRQRFPITAFDTRLLGFNLQLHHASLVDYGGPWGQGFSHSFNMMIIQTGLLEGLILTPDLRCYTIYSEDGETWHLPCGFFSHLTLDSELHRWTLTHFSGVETVFYQAVQNCPGYPISIREPNGNTTRLEYDASGLLQRIASDLDQIQTFTYGPDGLLSAFTDHIRRQWIFSYDAKRRLTQIKTPTTRYADIRAGQDITDSNLNDVLVEQARTWTLGYLDRKYQSHITSRTDQRGATPAGFSYDAQGRVRAARINGKDVFYLYKSEQNPNFDDPNPLPPLEESNLCTRVIDREGNITDYEIHGSAGSPVNGHGKYGLRRTITWTERGKGNAPLREDEPLYWEQRWLHDCDCLSPIVAVQPFSNEDAEGFTYDANGIPQNWPRDIYTYNANRQVTFHEYTDGTDSIATRSSYQPHSFGNQGQFSRLLSNTDPRTFDENPLYAGLNFEHSYAYDVRGNRILHNAPTVTRGLNTPQIISETWTYNAFGQVLTHTDPNGNITLNTYYDGSSNGGDINAKGAFGGYLKSFTRGAERSADPATNLTTIYRVNALGMTTQEIDPKGFVYDTEYNDLQETTREIEPVVTLRNGKQVRYETRHIYDGAGNEVIHRRSNIDFNGSTPANTFIDHSMTYDAVNNLLSERVEVDENDENDLVTSYAYDGNDDLIVTRKPEGNREFQIYDERRFLYKTFYGLAPGLTLIPIKLNFPQFDKRRLLLQVFNAGSFDLGNSNVISAYPTDKRAVTLARLSFVGLTVNTYDARRNLIRVRDGRGNLTNRFFDFYNRQIAYSDQNGNGWVREFDDASNVITESKGAVSPATGKITQFLEHSYMRFDELGRGYQKVLDIDLGTDEGPDVNPDDGKNSSYLTAFDAGSRVIMEFDANGNPVSMTYDAANRALTVTDALNNTRSNTYDLNSNVIRVTETEMPGPGAGGAPEKYVTTFSYDELNRQTEQHILGLNGNSIDHASIYAYDSRNNMRLMQDAEGNVALITFDDFNRKTVEQRFDGDPMTGTPLELLHYEWAYDRNSRLTEQRAFSDVSDPDSAQITRYAYDNLDRLVRTVYPDSDDPIDGSGNGADGIFDRVEITYDPNSSPVKVTEQRGVVFNNSFDPGNRLTEQNIVLPDTVPGTTKQVFIYDALNRTISAQNDFAKVDHTYDAFSRLTAETQSIRLDGSGFTRGWEQPVQVTSDYDKQSNRNACRVLDNSKTDLDVSLTFDALNRVGNISAQYFQIPAHPIARYTYIGPRRVWTKTLGNGAALTQGHDSKRRIKSHQWNGPNRILVGFEYDYDRMDNVLYERFTHDMGLCDHFQYNNRYEVTGVTYRVPGAVAPATPTNTFEYDDVLNRRQANFGNPFDAISRTTDSYAINKANEYTQLTRNGNITTPMHDRAGNTTSFLVLPTAGNPHQQDVTATARWDAFNCLFDVEPGTANAQQHYRYDAFRRRIATMELSEMAINTGSKRYIYDGWNVVEERLFDDDASLSSALSTLERIYVNGMQIDEPLLTAIDRNRDGELGGSNDKNLPSTSADQEYYFLNNRLGSVMALLDADSPDRVLEYYRYTLYGEPTVLPVLDDNGDGLEDSPLDLSDNFSAIAQRGSVEFGNVYLYTARRFDFRTGLYYFRNRFYDARTGRFITRDPIDFWGGMNVYGADFVNHGTDPLGLYRWSCKNECPTVNQAHDKRSVTGIFFGTPTGQAAPGGVHAGIQALAWSEAASAFSNGASVGAAGTAVAKSSKKLVEKATAAVDAIFDHNRNETKGTRKILMAVFKSMKSQFVSIWVKVEGKCCAKQCCGLIITGKKSRQWRDHTYWHQCKDPDTAKAQLFVTPLPSIYVKSKNQLAAARNAINQALPACFEEAVQNFDCANTTNNPKIDLSK